MIFYRNALIAWKTKQQETTAMSSTEAEYMALSEVVMMMKHIKMILDFCGFPYTEPSTIFCANTGTIFLANNWVMSQHTKHIDVRHHFIREYIEDGKYEVIFIHTNENPADMLTKNFSSKKFNYHWMTMMDRIGHIRDLTLE